MPEIQRINYRHEAILNWMVSNPDKTLGQCAAELGFTQAWLSTVIHSDAFQMLYRERMEALGQGLVHSVKDRLAGVAGLALEKTAERLEKGASDDFLAATTKNALNALGFAPARGGGSQVQQKVELHLSEGSLVAARERARSRFEGGEGRLPFLSSLPGGLEARGDLAPRTGELAPRTMSEEVEARSVPLPRQASSESRPLTLAVLLGGLEPEG